MVQLTLQLKQRPSKVALWKLVYGILQNAGEGNYYAEYDIGVILESRGLYHSGSSITARLRELVLGKKHNTENKVVCRFREGYLYKEWSIQK